MSRRRGSLIMKLKKTVSAVLAGAVIVILRRHLPVTKMNMTM